MPTEIRYTTPWKVAAGVLLWGALIGLLGYYGVTRSYDDYQFSHHAAPTTGSFLSKHYTVSHGRHGTSYTYYVEYTYVVGNVNGYCQQSVLYGTYCYLGSDKGVPLMYLPDNPGRVRLNLLNEERQIHNVTWTVSIMAGIFLLLGGIAFSLTFRANAIYQRLLREGQLCRAVVTDVTCTYVGKSRTPKYRLELRYRDQLGNELSGQSAFLPQEEEGRWHEGKQIDLRYDRNKPRWFILDFNPRWELTPEFLGSRST